MLLKLSRGPIISIVNAEIEHFVTAALEFVCIKSEAVVNVTLNCWGSISIL